MKLRTGLAGFFTNPHYKMERFAAMVLVFVLLLGSIFGYCMKQRYDANQITLGAQSLYTGTTYFSLTGEEVSVVGGYRDTNFTKYMFLLKAPSMTNLPSEASKYQMFLTSGNPKSKLTCDPKGSIYVFGNTGYIGLYFYDASGFGSNLYKVTLRNTDMMVEGNKETAAYYYPDAGDSSFSNFNQCRVIANFAGTAAPVADFLNAESFTANDVYTELVLETGSRSTRETLNQQLYTMNIAMETINNYKERLDNFGMVVPDLPVAIAGDQIVNQKALTEANPTEFTASMLSNRSHVNDDYDVTVDVEDEEYATNDQLYLVTDYVFPGGVQYNYQDVKISDHVLDALKPEDINYRQWKQGKTIEGNTYAVSSPRFTWRYKDGKTFVPDENTKAVQIQSDITVYETAVNAMFSAKKQFQTETLYLLLEIDNANRGISDLFSVEASDNTLLLY